MSARIYYNTIHTKCQEVIFDKRRKTLGITVIGAVFVDIKGYPTDKYIPGGKNAGRVEQAHGGVSRNIVEDIANVELRPTFVSVVDDSTLGDDVVKKLENHKVNTKYIKKTEDGLGTWLAIFDNTGDVVAAISKRPDLSGIAETLNESGDEIFENSDSIAIEIDAEREILHKTFELAEKFHKDIYAVVSNMSIAVERRDYIKRTKCFICNKQEAGIFFSDDYEQLSSDEMRQVLSANVMRAQIPCMVVTLGEDGAVYATKDGKSGYCPAKHVNVVDTTGAGDSFFAGVTIGMTYGKSLEESLEIGSRLAASVISTRDNVCPRFLPSEFGFDCQ